MLPRRNFSDTLLNPAQKKAVEMTEGMILILAGAGSGKTRVLTSRMAYLIEERGVDPPSILGLTFTNKAAKEMRDRLSNLIGEKKGGEVTLSTFHSFCLAILRKEIEALGFTRNFSLWDAQDVERVIRVMARDILEKKGEMPSLAPTFKLIHQIRSKNLDPEELREESWHESFAKALYKRLKEAFRAFNALDFDGLLTETVHLFQAREDILRKYQDQYRYIMIDEYQDTNPIQYQLASLLSGRWGNLCAVGDDDQSIYGWRGATLDNILHFSGKKRCEIIKLEENFRSTKVILDSANAVIKKNQKRHVKSLWSQKGVGEPIEIFHAPTPENEAEAISSRLVFLQEKTGYPWSSFAVIYRSNSLSHYLEMALQKSRFRSNTGMVMGIPYQVFGGTEFFDKKEIKDLASYLRFLINPQDEASLLRIINYPRRGIGEATLDKLTAYNRQRGVPLFEVLQKAVAREIDLDLSEKSHQALCLFLELIKRAKNRQEELSSASFITWLIEEINFEKAIDEEFASEKMRLWKRENIQKWMEFLSSTSESWKEILSSLYLGDRPGLFAKEKREERVSLMTIHSSKGLEFPVLFIMGLEDHILPHERSMQEPGGIEEERRLFYVAMTRAKERLILSMARRRKRVSGEVPSEPSRFLFDIPKECLRSTRWDTIS